MALLARAWAVLLLGACAARAPVLEPSRELVARKPGDLACGPVGVRRGALGSRWGEYLAVRVTSPVPLTGEARLHVAGRALPLRAFSVAAGDQDAPVVEQAWRNERLSVPSALERGAVIDVTVTGLTAPGGDCRGVSFSVEQGAFRPSVDEAQWVALLEARGGPDVEAWRAQRRPPPPARPASAVAARSPSPPRAPAAPRHAPRPPTRGPDATEWAQWVKEDVTGPEAQRWAEWPLATVIANAHDGDALTRGCWVALVSHGDDVRANTDAAARGFGLSPPRSSAELGAVVRRARESASSDHAAVLMLFAGLEETRAALKLAGADGSLEALTMFLPRHRAAAAGAAAQAMTLATAFALGWPLDGPRVVSSPFGLRRHPTLGGIRLHTGVDLPVPVGTPVRAVAPGLVVRAGTDDVNGRYVIVDHGYGVTTASLHNSSVLVVEGQRVEGGEVIAASGNTGRSTGPHLHYQLEIARRPVDPLLFQPRPSLSEAISLSWASGEPHPH